MSVEVIEYYILNHLYRSFLCKDFFLLNGFEIVGIGNKATETGRNR